MTQLYNPADTSNLLPLTGGTLTGTLLMDEENHIAFRNSTEYIYSRQTGILSINSSSIIELTADRIDVACPFNMGDDYIEFSSSYIENIGGPTLWANYKIWSEQGIFYFDGTRDTGNALFAFLTNISCEDITCDNQTVQGNISFDTTSRTIAGIQNQNLLDKTASETITGLYLFDGGLKLNDGDTVSFGDSSDSTLKFDGTQMIWHFPNVSTAGKTLLKFDWDYYYTSYGWYDAGNYGGMFEVKAGGDYGEKATVCADTFYISTDAGGVGKVEWKSGAYITDRRFSVNGFYEYTATTGHKFKSTYSGASIIFSFNNYQNKVLFSVSGNGIISFGGRLVKSGTAIADFDIGESTESKQARNIWMQGNLNIDNDTGKLQLGTDQDAGIWYDGTDLKIDSAQVGSGTIDLVSQAVTSISSETLSEYVTIKIGGVLKKIAIVA